MESQMLHSDSRSAEMEKAGEKDRAKLAAERRAQIMAQLKSAQNSFLSTNAKLFEATTTSAPVHWLILHLVILRCA